MFWEIMNKVSIFEYKFQYVLYDSNFRNGPWSRELRILAHVHSDQMYFVITLKQNEQLIS